MTDWPRSIFVVKTILARGDPLLEQAIDMAAEINQRMQTLGITAKSQYQACIDAVPDPGFELLVATYDGHSSQ